jgi:DNA-binding CsgD family transcriptional regulator
VIQLDRPERACLAVTDIVRAILESNPQSMPDIDALIARVLGVLRESVGADSAGFYRHIYGGATTALCIDPSPLWKAIPAPELPTSTACAIHPGVRYFMHRRATRPFEITDVISEQAWLSSELGSAMRPDWGRNHQLAIPLNDTFDTTRHAWIVGRERAGFSAADREVVTAAQPVLDALTRHYALQSEIIVRGAVFAGLTAREQTVAALLSGNEPAAVIARRLGISERTVHKHTERLYRKLDVHDRHALRSRILDAAS